MVLDLPDRRSAADTGGVFGLPVKKRHISARLTEERSLRVTTAEGDRLLERLPERVMERLAVIWRERLDLPFGTEPGAEEEIL